MTEAERHYKAIEAGVDQFGGNNEMGPVIEAYQMGVSEHGEEFMRQRFEQSAIRLLRNLFRVGLFENPYLDVSETEKTVGSPDFMKAGYARETSIAGGSPLESFTNRSYKGKTTVASNIQDMKTVEEQFEDVPRDMKCYVDSEGNTYDFAFGLNWTGMINDARGSKYRQ